MALAAVSLEDKYALESGRVYLTGVQALVRLPMLQRQRDQAAGLNTGGFISGYRGSPLGGLDKSLWEAQRFLERGNIHFKPGLNEDLAATAVWGSQQLDLFPKGAKVDGVFSMWYGKGPGVDRSGDVLKHGNAAGTARHGGVLVLAGDDHNAKSSTFPHQTEYAFMDAMIPVLNPAGVQEILEHGLFGWALSRYSGCWVAMKTIAETVDSSASVTIDPLHPAIILPTDFEMPPGGVNIRSPDKPLDQEYRLMRHKLYAALAFARANRLDRTIIASPNPRLGIVTTGKSYLDVRQALEDLGIDDALAAHIGLTLYKVGMPWPLEREGIRHFAEGLQEIIVIEEKRALIENQLKEQLYNWREDVRPRVVGKFSVEGEWQLPSAGELSPAQIARVIARHVTRFYDSERIHQRLAVIEGKEREIAGMRASLQRVPTFCSGCPHNSSTKVPEGSRALAGIGCHYMVTWMHRDSDVFSQMGGEGVQWIGQEPFTETPHVFANLGDGTYFHSGYLAIRAAVAAKANITYKILFNDAVAMTGGQPVDGQLTVPQISRQLAAEGVKTIVVVTDEPDKYPLNADFAHGVTVEHRDDLDAVQRRMREVEGVTAIIYDQTCATEKRRRRKRGTLVDPAKRVVINESVCEGCGDCGVQSNCVSLVPAETEFGRKRQIDQSSCNKDFSCVRGFCPSFVTVKGGQLKKIAPRKGQGAGTSAWPALPEPAIATVDQPYGILVTGVGGNGVVTIGALLGMAAHLENKGCSVLDMTGLAQKGGAVFSHIRIAATPEDINAVRIATGAARLVLGTDLLTTANLDALSKMRPGHTMALVNDHAIMTSDFTRTPDLAFPSGDLTGMIRAAAGQGGAEFFDATQIATALMGDAIAANAFMLGFAAQRGLLPVSVAAIERAIELNNVAVGFNKQAFLWGRRAGHDLAAVQRAATPAPEAQSGPRKLSESLEEAIERRVAFLTAYQNSAYAAGYQALVTRAREVETARLGKTGLTAAVARYLFKLMAYKDEYEVARLYTDGSFARQIAASFEGDFKLEFNLAPPLLAKRDPTSGHLRKQQFGPWMMGAFRLLARLRFLRGSKLDIFGYTDERRTERQLIGEYRMLVEELLTRLSPDNHELAIQLASIPEQIRGYGHVKEAHLAKAKAREAELLARLRSPAPAPLPVAAE